MTTADQNSSPHPSASRSYATLALLAFLALLLIAFQYTTIEKFNLLPPSKHFITFQNFLHALDHYGIALDYRDSILAGLIALEWTQHRLTNFLEHILRSERLTTLFLTLTSLLLVRFYFARGDATWAADASLHTTYAWIAAKSFAAFEFPIWTNYFTTGSPYLQFYGFLFFYTVGLMDLFVNHLFSSIKLVLAAGHILSGWGMYLFVRTLTRSRRAGLIAGLAYVLSFWHTQQVLIMGRLPLALFYALLPWPFFFIEQLRFSHKRSTALLGGALCLGALAFTHPGYAFWATGFLAVYIVLRYCLNPQPHILPATLGLFGGGILIGAYLTLPMWLEREHTGLFEGFSMSHVPDPTWQQLLFWSNHRFALFAHADSHTHWYGGYLGITLITLSLFGLIGLFQSRHPRHRSAIVSTGICLIGSLILVFGFHWPVLRSLSIVQALNAGRYLLFVVFFMSALAGIGAHTVMAKYPPTRTCTLLLTLILLDLGPTTFQHPYQAGDSGDPELITSDTHFDSFQKEIQDIPPDELPNSRVFYTTNQTYRALVISWFAIFLNQPSIYPLYNEHTLSYTTFIQPFETLTVPSLIGLERYADLSSQPLTEEIFKAFYLLNIQHVLISQPEQSRAMKWRLPNVKPIVVAPRATPLSLLLNGSNASDLLQTWPQLMQAMGPINDQAGSCAQILLADLPTPENLQTTPAVEVLKHHVWNQRVELTVDISSPCYARLAYAYYPYLTVTVDGKPVQPFQTAGRFIALRLDKGKHDIVITPYLSPLRKILLILNLGWIGLAFGMRWRRRA